MLLRCRGTLGVAARALPHLRAWVAGPARSLPPTEAPTIAGGHRELTMSTDASGASAKKRRKKRPSPEVEAMKMRSLVPSVGDFPGGPGLGGAASLDGIASPSTSHTRRERFDGDLFYDRVIPALRYFYEVHSHLNVHKLYTVPDESHVPEDIRGFALGKRVDNIRARGDFVKSDPGKLDALMALGGASPAQKFVWKSKKWVFDHQIVPALRYFKRKHGHLIVPRDYVTPEFERDLEPHARLFALGSVSHDMRNKAKGFTWTSSPNACVCWTRSGSLGKPRASRSGNCETCPRWSGSRESTVTSPCPPRSRFPTAPKPRRADCRASPPGRGSV